MARRSADVLDVITHRGPDDRGTYVSPCGFAFLGNTRLKILDLSAAGHMPMTNEDRTVWVTYNGEIYNYASLRRELEARGHVFTSTADTEVVVHGYEEWGIGLLTRLNGMFAFAVWDESRGSLLLARDHLGIKPLYYAVCSDSVYFASECKSIIASGALVPELNLAALPKYLGFLWTPAPETMLEGVLKLPPGHYLEWSHGEVRTNAYWDLDLTDTRDAPLEEHAALLRAALVDSVERQLRSDVPVGILLSGGLDSTGLLSLALQQTGEPIDCYTIAFREQDAAWEQCPDDALYARRVAQHYGVPYHEIVSEPRHTELLPRLMWHMDEPIADPAAINTYLICEAAREQVTVLLSGQGADELFAGYRVHTMHLAAERYGWLRFQPALSAMKACGAIAGHLGGHVPGISPGMGLAVQRTLGRVAESASKDRKERALGLRSYYGETELGQLLTPEALSASHESYMARHAEYYERVAELDPVSQALYLDTKLFLPELNLAYCDKMSMAASVETRVPYLDMEVVEVARRIPSGLKARGLSRKIVLRHALRNDVPEWVSTRRKAGFGSPIRGWLRTELTDLVDDLLSEETVRRRGLFRPETVRKMVSEHRVGDADHTYRIWALLTLESWQRSVVDGQYVPTGGSIT